jgi:hypothetical protein
MFDVLVRLASGAQSTSAVLLRFKSQTGDKDVEKLFLSDEAALQ